MTTSISVLHRVVAATMALGLATLPAGEAEGWATAEHVRFGQDIARAFEELMGERLPVIEATLGPKTFGHYVSAPDFARGLLLFLNEKAVAGLVPCGNLWNPEGVIDGEEIDDQALADADDSSLADQPAKLDCVNGWRLNNSHFGDFAANHYLYYHALAIEAGRRYRATRQPTCRAAAYTLEGWGQHYLTDSTAAGHAWNPAGSYDIEIGFQTITGVQDRMRIHDFLNDNGALMGESYFDQGTFWGDHSEKHTDGGKSVPDLGNDNAQRALTIRLSRMGLGQVVAAAECGAAPTSNNVLADVDDDPRRIYASNQSMCSAMYGHEIRWWIPNFLDPFLFGIDLDQVESAFKACKSDDGELATLRDGIELARHYFPDSLPHFHAEDGFVSDTVDGKAELTLEDLECLADAPVVPLASPGEVDMCGQALCETPISIDGKCPSGSTASGGCCAERADPSELRDLTATTWTRVAQSAPANIDTPGALLGGAAEFLSVGNPGPHRADASTLDNAKDGDFQTLGGEGADVRDCKNQNAFEIYDALVEAPNDVGATLVIKSMDEGLRVQVDGHVVGFVRGVESPVAIRIAAPGQTARVRITHLNSCGDARPLVVAVSRDDKADALLTADEGGGCSTSGGSSPTWLALLLLGLAIRFGRKGRRAN